MYSQQQHLQSSPSIPVQKFSAHSDLPSRNNIVKLAGTVDNIVQPPPNQLQLGSNTAKMHQKYSSNALPIASGVLLNVSGGTAGGGSGAQAPLNAPIGQLDHQGRPYNQIVSNPAGRGANARYQQNSQQARSNIEGLYSTGNIQVMNTTY